MSLRNSNLPLPLLAAAAILLLLGGVWWAQSNVTPVVSIPTPIMPSPNAFDIFNAAAAAQVHSLTTAYPIRPLSPAQAAANVAQNTRALTLLRQGLSRPYENPPIRSFTARFGYYANDHSLVRLLAREAHVQETQGDWNGAINSSLDGMQIGAMIPHGSSLIGNLVGIACQAISRKPAWGIVQHLNAAQSEAAARRLQQIQSLHVSYADALQQEEWAVQASLLNVFRLPDWRTGLKTTVIYTGQGPLTPLQQAQLYLSSKSEVLFRYTAAMNALRRHERQPYAAHPPSPHRDPLTQALTNGFAQARYKETITDVENMLLLGMLALRAYRVQHGAYPPNLQALVPKYLKAVPSDPFALSGPLRYKRQGRSYVLYSIGPDGKDDGGKAIVQRRDYVQESDKGDIVAGVNQE